MEIIPSLERVEPGIIIAGLETNNKLQQTNIMELANNARRINEAKNIKKDIEELWKKRRSNITAIKSLEI